MKSITDAVIGVQAKHANGIYSFETLGTEVHGLFHFVHRVMGSVGTMSQQTKISKEDFAVIGSACFFSKEDAAAYLEALKTSLLSLPFELFKESEQRLALFN